jgi:hypothetical protein
MRVPPLQRNDCIREDTDFVGYANPEGQLVVGIQFDAQAFNDAW